MPTIWEPDLGPRDNFYVFGYVSEPALLYFAGEYAGILCLSLKPIGPISNQSGFLISGYFGDGDSSYYEPDSMRVSYSRTYGGWSTVYILPDGIDVCIDIAY